MLLEEYRIKTTNFCLNSSILATDVSTKALQKAATGKFSQLEIQRGLPPQLLVKYFTKDIENFWTLKNSVRERVELKLRNLLNFEPSPEKFDLILCRNILIYQRVEKRVHILNRLASQLSPDGILLLGAGESLVGMKTQLETFDIGGVIFLRRILAMSQAA